MTAPLVPEGLEPLAVWDAGDGTGPFAVTPGGEAFRRSFESACWMVGHIDRARDVVRLEFYVFDSPCAVVHRYAADIEHRKYQVGEEIARDAPVVVPLAELPPGRLLKG